MTAQRPAAMLKVAGKDGLTAVDNQTRVLNSVTNQAVKGIPVIEVKNIDDALGQRSVRAAVTILDAMPESFTHPSDRGEREHAGLGDDHTRQRHHHRVGRQRGTETQDGDCRQDHERPGM